MFLTVTTILYKIVRIKAPAAHTAATILNSGIVGTYSVTYSRGVGTKPPSVGVVNKPERFKPSTKQSSNLTKEEENKTQLSSKTNKTPNILGRAFLAGHSAFTGALQGAGNLFKNSASPVVNVRNKIVDETNFNANLRERLNKRRNPTNPNIR